MWSYRLVELEYEGDKSYVLSEVYFNSKREPYAYCEATIVTNTPPEAAKVLTMMEDALRHPVVRPGDFVEDME